MCKILEVGGLLMINIIGNDLVRNAIIRLFSGEVRLSWNCPERSLQINPGGIPF